MLPSAANPPEKPVPLCVDLDGTLIRTDVLWESMMLLLRHNPLYLLALPFWLLRGRAFLKQQIAARTELNPAALPYHQGFLEYLRNEQRQGRPLILATAADTHLAQRVAGTSRTVRRSHRQQRRNQPARQQTRAAHSQSASARAASITRAIPPWTCPSGRRRAQAIVVNAGERPGANRPAGLAKSATSSMGAKSCLRALFKALRPHQWVKNLIIFVPLLTSHQIHGREFAGRRGARVCCLLPLRLRRLSA